MRKPLRSVLLLVCLLTVAATLGILALARTLPSPAPPQAATAPEQRVLRVLDEMRNSRRTYLSVNEVTGRMLRLLTEAAGAKHVVEIGTSTGYSGLWFCLALQRTGGRLTTFEIDPNRAAQARQHFRQAGVDELAVVVEGDAHRNVTRLAEPIDILFLDADKDGYVDYLNKLRPLVRPGGLILADNMISAPAYVEAVNTDPALETLYIGFRFGVTLKKRFDREGPGGGSDLTPKRNPA